MRSLSARRLAVWQCLTLSLLVSTKSYASAWIPSSSKRGRTFGWDTTKAARYYRPTSLAAGDGVLDFVKGLDSALGNPTAQTAVTETIKAPAVPSSFNSLPSAVSAFESEGGAVNMAIPNELVLAGGALAFLTFAGLALYFLFQNQGDSNTNGEAFDFKAPSFGIEEVAAIPKVVDQGALSKQLEAAQTSFQEKQDWQPAPAQTATAVEEKVAVVVKEKVSKVGDIVTDSDESGGSLLSKLKAKLARKTEELEENQVVLEEERTVRKEAETKLAAATTENEELTEKMATQEKLLVETTEKWDYTKTKLLEETKIKETLQSDLAQATESNRLLEDKYELEQNVLQKTKKDLDATQSTLETTESRLIRTQGEQTRVFRELQTTQQTLSDTSADLERLEADQKRMRTLAKKMWRLSKSRVSSGVQSVGDRLRRRGPKKDTTDKTKTLDQEKMKTLN
jgi:hypothetical protein